jgi:hypothetical protein
MRTWSIQKRGKIVEALIKGNITAEEALAFMIEADNRECLAKKVKNATKR